MKQCKQIPSKKEKVQKKEVSEIFQYKQKVSKIPTRNSAKHLK